MENLYKKVEGNRKLTNTKAVQETQMLKEYRLMKDKEKELKDYYASLPEIHEIITNVIGDEYFDLNNKLDEISLMCPTININNIATFLQRYNLGRIVVTRYNVGNADMTNRSLIGIDWRKDITVKDLLDAFYMELQTLEIYFEEPDTRVNDYEKLMKVENEQYIDKFTDKFIDIINSLGGFNKFIPLRLYYKIQGALEEIDYNYYAYNDNDSDYALPNENIIAFKNFLESYLLLSETQVKSILNVKAVKRILTKNKEQ